VADAAGPFSAYALEPVIAGFTVRHFGSGGLVAFLNWPLLFLVVLFDNEVQHLA